MLTLRSVRQALVCAPHVHVSLALLTMVIVIAGRPGPAFGAGIGPTVKEVVEFTRIVQPQGHDNDALQEQVSPDGKRAFIVTRRAHVRSDENRFDIVLLDVRGERITAGLTDAPQTVLSVVATNDPSDADPSLRSARWVGNQTIVFRARMHDRPFQVYALEVFTRVVRPLTAEPQGVVEFAVSDDLRRVVYLAPVPNPAFPEGARSVVVGTHSFWSVHFGQNNLATQQRRYRWMVADAGSPEAARPLGDAFAEASNGWPLASISPDGRWAVLPVYEPGRQVEWAQRYPSVAETTADAGPSRARDPLGYYSRPISYVPRRHVAYRLADGAKQAIVDAPDDSRPGGGQFRSDRIWSADGKSVVIAGTHLPRSSVEGPSDPAAHFIEYWPEERRWKDIAVLKQRLVNAFPLPAGNGFVAIDGEHRRRFERSGDGTWTELADGAVVKTGDSWQLRIAEALNQPPDVVASRADGRIVRLTDLNPQFSAVTWGSMRAFAWKDARGRSWEGGLMVPADFDPKARHALVIQSYGFSRTRFYRDGSNIYDGFTSGFAGRAFLREDILVLALPYSASTNAPRDEHGAIVAFEEGVRGAIEALVAAGTVDRGRIGILGWSATGERVLNLVTFSDAPIRAASLLDGDANTLFAMTITYAFNDGSQIGKERTNGGGPFGPSLRHWINNDPSLHTDCLRSALRIESYGPEVHNNWDIYALLRRQYKPAELIVFPQGGHSLSRPSDRMISLQGNVDWYRFWLKGEERTELVVPGESASTLGAQYVRWRQMKGLSPSSEDRSGCVRGASTE